MNPFVLSPLSYESEYKFKTISPVLPSADIDRDIKWYTEKLGFANVSHDAMYAVLSRDGMFIHLQWHAGTDDDPLLGGSVIKTFVDDIQPYFKEFVDKKMISVDMLNLNTDWGTHEFGFFDLNKNAIFIVQDIY